MMFSLTPRIVHGLLPRDYWHVKEPAGTNFTPGTLGGYYIDMQAKAGSYHGPTHDGFPLRNQNREGLQLLPSTIAQLALGHYEAWLDDNDGARLERFLGCADWLVKNHLPCPHKLPGWHYLFDHGRLSIRAPFISAMGQGQGISVLTRAHQLTKKQTYLDTAIQALQPFHCQVAKGGVTAHLGNGDLYFEEYPCRPYSHILNGHIFALWGLYDFAVYQQDALVKQLFQSGTHTLAKLLPRYDLGNWTRYGLFPHPRPNIASPFYHELHIAQMHAMYKLTKIAIFLDYAKAWETQFDGWWNFFRAVLDKVRFKAWVKSQKKRFPEKDGENDCGHWIDNNQIEKEITANAIV